LFQREVGDGEAKEGMVPSGYARMRTDRGSKREQKHKNKFFFV
jgi:hypothetical protein